jgi:hypothetical protein
MYFFLKLESQLVIYKLHNLVVNTKICGVLDLFEKVLHLAWLTTGILSKKKWLVKL